MEQHPAANTMAPPAITTPPMRGQPRHGDVVPHHHCLLDSQSAFDRDVFLTFVPGFDRDVFLTFVPGRTAVRVTELAAQLGRLEAETRSARSAAAVAEMRAEVRLWPSGRR